MFVRELMIMPICEPVALEEESSDVTWLKLVVVIKLVEQKFEAFNKKNILFENTFWNALGN